MQGILMKQFYVHVQPFEATTEQVEKFKEIMKVFRYFDFIISDEIEYQLPPGGFVGKSSAECKHIVDQTFSIANTAGFNAYIFVCEFSKSSDLLGAYGIRP